MTDWDSQPLFESKGNIALKDDREREVMDVVSYIPPIESLNTTEKHILLVDAESASEAKDYAEEWVNLTAQLDGDLIEIGDEVELEELDETAMDRSEHELPPNEFEMRIKS
jgi:hypothetical protein